MERLIRTEAQKDQNYQEHAMILQSKFNLRKNTIANFKK